MFKTVTNRFMSSIFPTPVWAPPGGGGGGGVPEDDGFDDGGGEELDPGDEFTDDDMLEGGGQRQRGESGKDDEISLESPDFLSQFWGENEQDDEDEDDDAGDDEESQRALGAEIKSMIEGYSVPEDLIPEDFDVSDPKQLRTLLSNVGRQAIALALKASFKPTAAALNQQASRMRKEMQNFVEEHSSGSSVRSRLLEAIPAAGDKQHRKILQVVLDQAKSKFPKDSENQLRSARKALAALGINQNTRTSSGSGRRQTRGEDYSSVLDSFAPLPQRRPEGRASGRMRSTR